MQGQIFLKWESIFDAIGHPVTILDTHHTVIAANRATLKLTGKTESEMIGKKCFELFHGKDVSSPPEGCPMEKLLRSGRVETYQMDVETLGGHFLVSCTPVFDGNGVLQNIIHIATDVTEHRIAEENFRAIFENANDGILVADTETKVFFMGNRAVSEMLGYSIEEIKGLSVLDIHPPEELPNVLRAFESQARREIDVAGDIPVLRKDGSIRYVDISSAPVTIFGKQCLIGFFRDITERKRLEEQLLHSQKMEAVGHLAGGIAHDFNNILTAIVGYAHLALMKMGSAGPVRSYVEQILSSSEKAAGLTQSLLAFSRKQVMEMMTIDINDILIDIRKILDRIIGEDIRVMVTTAGNELPVLGDKGQLEQVFMNLATNARDAMPRGGTFAITAEEVLVDTEFIAFHQYGEPGRYAVISVSDTGIGMDEKTKERIFEPFYTTKDIGRGTGLGLAMVYGTIKQHNGFISVHSSPGEGTTFRIYLPITDIVIQKAGEKEPAGVPFGNETILFIEDNESVRRSTKELLEELGYKVIEAVNGDQAIALFRENHASVELVISDIIMPGQSGKSVYDKMKQISPDVKVLFISGYSADQLSRKGIIEEGINLLPKPFGPDKLSAKIREVLEGRA